MRAALPLLLGLALPACAAPLDPLRQGSPLKRAAAAFDVDVDALRSAGQKAAGDALARARLNAYDALLGTNTYDAVLAGAIAGFACGKLLIGDPITLALAGSLSFGAAEQYPLSPRIPRPLVLVTHKSANAVARLRARRG